MAKGKNMKKMMEWKKLLSRRRLGKGGVEEPAGRSPFQRDFDRIIFSSAFRRLQDKTQVYPLAESDYVRTRLTHSLEVSCVGRSIGEIVGKAIIEKHQLKDYHHSDFGSIVASASLAHDIGNPPLGHSGEDAIQHWFRHTDTGNKNIESFTDAQKNDFLKFEGNAQGFRLLSKLQTPDNKGGMQLTCATLAAYTKYPRESHVEGAENDLARKSAKKFGFFQDDKELFSEVAEVVGLLPISGDYAWWCRHPLAFLVEAADDITYTIIDFEDGCRLGLISYDELFRIYKSILTKTEISQLNRINAQSDKIEYLRAKAINKLIFEVVEVFNSNEPSILAGEYDQALTGLIPSAKYLTDIISLSRKKAYSAREVIEIEAAGFEVLGRLIELFIQASDDIAKTPKPSARSKKLYELLPDKFAGKNRKPDKSQYTRLINVTDFISGMTDSFAVSLYKKMSGISLPGGR